MDIFLEGWKKYLQEAVITEASKPKKPDCESGNKWHDEDGKFTSKKDAKSWAGGYDSEGKTDCTYGKFKTKGDGKKLITRHSCGKDEDGVGKHPYKCKNGEPAFEEGLEQQDAAYLRGIISAELERAIKKHMQSSGCSFNDLIRAMTAWSQAEQGGKKKS